MAELSPRIVDLEPQETIAVRGEVAIADLPAFFSRAFGEAAHAAAAAEVAISGPPFGFYPRMPGATVTVEAGFPVAAPCDPDGDAHRLVLPGGRVVEVVHVGPYETMEQTYRTLQTWMAEQGLQPSDGVREYYLSDPGAGSDPGTWRTRIVWPVA